MTMLFEKSIYWLLVMLCITFFPVYTDAVSFGNDSVVPHVDISLVPSSGSFVEGSTFDVPIIINTNTAPVGMIKVFIKYDKNKLAIVKPSGGTSVIGVWDEPPSYDNNKGMVTYIGQIPDGLVTQAGLISTITFKAIDVGKAIVSVEATSVVTLNDELGTQAKIDSNRSEYVVLKKVYPGVHVFSETHPLESKWYNNTSPVFSWDKDVDVTGFSFILDDKPSTVPDNTIDSEDVTKSFENLKDGLWYFHIKAQKNGVWGTAGHFLVRIDTAPPAEFFPKISTSLANVVMIRRTLVSFITSDNLSGVDHYEVGVIDESQPITKSPVFVQTESPFQVPLSNNSTMKVIVRAFDKAGNIREGFLSVKPGFNVALFVDTYFKLIIIILLVILTSYVLMRYTKGKRTRENTFGTVDDNVKRYLDEKKELHQQNIIEKEHLESLKKELLEVEKELDKEI